MRAQARRADFRPIEIKECDSPQTCPSRPPTIESNNVFAKLTGNEHPAETIMIAAHWNAFGVGTPDTQGRKIKPRAIDDALGVAGVLELARVFASGPRPKRLVFAAWTAAERGLIGSQPMPPIPCIFSKTVANRTLDILQTAGPARDALLVGAGQSTRRLPLPIAAL